MSDYAVKRYSRWRWITAVHAVALFSVIVVSLGVGFAEIPFPHVLSIIGGKIPFLGGFSGSSFSEAEELIILQIRLPRVMMAVLVGFALATAGSVFQGIFRNPMADPYVVGVSSGAALGAALAIVLGLDFFLFGFNSTTILAFVFAVATIFVVYNVARVGSRVPVATLLLTGIAASIFLSAVVAMLEVMAGSELHALIFWLMGGFSYVEWRDVQAVLPLIAVGMFVVYFYSRDLNIMLLGEEEAQHLGVDVEGSKKVLIAFASLVTAAAVSVSGLIGFVGLIVPHLTRMLVGSDHRILLPSAVMSGAILLVLCDALARVVFAPAEIPVGIVTVLLGGPFFIYLLKRRKGTYSF